MMPDIWFTIQLRELGSVSIPQRIVVAFGFIILFAFIRRLSVEYWGEWRSSHERIPPNLEGREAPIVTAAHGVRGCLLSTLLLPFWIACATIAFDLIMFEGRVIWTNWGRILTFLSNIPDRIPR